MVLYWIFCPRAGLLCRARCCLAKFPKWFQSLCGPWIFPEVGAVHLSLQPGSTVVIFCLQSMALLLWRGAITSCLPACMFLFLFLFFIITGAWTQGLYTSLCPQTLSCFVVLCCVGCVVFEFQGRIWLNFCLNLSVFKIAISLPLPPTVLEL